MILYRAILLQIVVLSFLSNNIQAINNLNCSDNAIEYKMKVSEEIKKLSLDDKQIRDSNIYLLKELELYKKLVTDEVIEKKYLTILNGIGLIISSKSHSGFTLSDELYNIISKEKDQEKFLLINLRIIAKGGLPPEIVDVFYRYKNKFGYYGENKTTFNTNNVEEILNTPYNLSIALCVFEPENKIILEKLYESYKTGNFKWANLNNNSTNNYSYPYIIFKESFQLHLNKIAPESKYNYLKYKQIDSVVMANYFEVSVLNCFVSNYVNTGNRFTEKHAKSGNTFVQLKVKYKNIDQVGREILSAGSLFINYNGKDYELNKTEIILADEFGVEFEGLNPLSNKVTWLIFPITKDYKGAIFWKPYKSDEKIFVIEM